MNVAIILQLNSQTAFIALIWFRTKQERHHFLTVSAYWGQEEVGEIL